VRLWAAALLGFPATVGALVLYAATGAGDCADCPKTWDQNVARVLLPVAALTWIGLLFARAVSARNVWEGIGAGILCAFATLFGLILAWILTSN
jgi:hypothetical protein